MLLKGLVCFELLQSHNPETVQYVYSTVFHSILHSTFMYRKPNPVTVFYSIFIYWQAEIGYSWLSMACSFVYLLLWETANNCRSVTWSAPTVCQRLERCYDNVINICQSAVGHSGAPQDMIQGSKNLLSSCPSK